MNETVTFGMTPTEAAQVQELAEKCLAAIRESNERAKQTDSEIVALQAETRVLLDQLRMRLDVETTR